MCLRLRPSTTGSSCRYLARAMIISTFMISEGCNADDADLDPALSAVDALAHQQHQDEAVTKPTL